MNKDCPVCGKNLLCEDIDSRQEWCEYAYHCNRCGNDFVWRQDFKEQSQAISIECWTFTKKELRKMEAAWDLKQSFRRALREVTGKVVPTISKKKKHCHGCLTPEQILKVLQTKEFYSFFTWEFDDYTDGHPDALDKQEILKYIENIFY